MNINDIIQESENLDKQNEQKINNVNNQTNEIKQLTDQLGFSNNLNDILSKVDSLSNEELEKQIAENKAMLEKLQNILVDKKSIKTEQTILNETQTIADTYIYNENSLKSFDSKIDVCKWFTRQIGTLINGKYNFSVRKNGVMCNPTELTKLACEQAYNYWLYDYAKPESGHQYIYFDVINNSNIVSSVSYLMPTHNNADLKSVTDWYLSYPYSFSSDMIEDLTEHRIFSVYRLKESSGSTPAYEPQKIAANSIACYNTKKTKEKRLIVTVIGYGYKVNKSKYRYNCLEDSITSEDYADAAVINTEANALNKTLYTWWANGCEPEQLETIKNNCKALYFGIALTDYYNNTQIITEYYQICPNSRYHITTTATPILIAKYLKDCGEDEIVDCIHNSSKDDSSLIRYTVPSTPKGSSAIFYKNYFIGGTSLEYGNNVTLYKSETTTLSQLFKYACRADNTYAIYNILLHLYKGFTNTTKDTISPLIESKTSLTDGYVQITFPESYYSKVETAGGESSLQYEKEIVKHKCCVSSTTENGCIDWKTTYTPTMNDVYYKVDLTNDYISFTDFNIGNYFNLALTFSIEDIADKESGVYIDQELLIATINNTEIYLCSNPDTIYPCVTSGSNYKQIFKSNIGVKIINEGQQIYMGIGPYDSMEDFTVETDNASTTYQQSKTNITINIAYENGIWDILKSYSARGT